MTALDRQVTDLNENASDGNEDGLRCFIFLDYNAEN